MANDNILLTVRGTPIAADLEATRVLHNETAGSPQGIAAARSLGDLSHMVYMPVADRGAAPNELLFIDFWETAKGIGDFFANPMVQQQGAKLFASKEPTLWMQARGGFSFDMPAPSQAAGRYVGMIRVPVTTPEAAVATFAAVGARNLRDARRRGQMSHQILFKLAAPNEPAELLGLDLWSSLDGLGEHYRADHMKELGSVFAGKPITSVWQQAAGKWSEW
jgi:hypothetical protein